MGATVDPTSDAPEFDISLTGPDGVTVNMVVCDARGKRAPEAIQAFPLDPEPVKTAQGDTKYSDLQQPYSTVAQSDWSGGRGGDDFEADRSRYLEGQFILPDSRGLILAGQPTFATGYKKEVNKLVSGGVRWVELRGSQAYIAAPVTALQAFGAVHVFLYARKVGNPTGGIDLQLHENNNFEPGIIVTSTGISSVEPGVISRSWFGGSTLNEGQIYWLRVSAATPGTLEDHWELGFTSDNVAGTIVSPDGTTWEYYPYHLQYRITELLDDFRTHFFEYKEQLYFATQPDDGSTGKVYMNGYRGVVDTNSLSKGKLLDATQTGWTDEEVGNIAKVITGKPTSEYQNWRKVTSGTSGELEVLPYWIATHNGTEEYVVLGSNKFFQLTTPDITGPVTDAVEAEGILHVTQDDRTSLMYAVFGEGGTLSQVWEAGPGSGDFVEAIDDPQGGAALWFASNKIEREGKPVIYRKWAPQSISDILQYTILVDKGLAWNEQATPNVTRTLSDTRISFAVAAAFTTGMLGSQAVLPVDVTHTDKLTLSLTSTIDLAAGDLQLLLDNSATCASPVFTLNLPALKANIPTNVYLDFTPEGVAGADAIISIGLQLTADKAAFTLHLNNGGRILMMDSTERIALPARMGRITGLERYGDPETLWVLMEGGIGEVRNNQFLPVPLREMLAVKNHTNGAAHCVSDVYLITSLGTQGGLQRFYRQDIQAIGLDVDTALLTVGPVNCVVPYPGGRLFAAAGRGVFYRNAYGWHEIYRSSGDDVKDLYIQQLPDGVTRLWINAGTDILWIPISLNPAQDTDFRYNYEGSLTTGWMYTGLMDVSKQFRAIKVFAEGLVEGTTSIEVDYQLDNDAGWTKIPGSATGDPVTELPLSTATPPDVSGRRIRFRFRLYTTDDTKSPRLKSSVLKYFSTVETKYGYSFLTKISEGELSLNKEGDEVPTLNQFSSAEDAWAKLIAWANSAAALTLSTTYSMYAGTVILKPPPGRGKKILHEEQIEEAVVQVTLHEI
jgi:hypothetical protein